MWRVFFFPTLLFFNILVSSSFKQIGTLRASNSVGYVKPPAFWSTLAGKTEAAGHDPPSKPHDSSIPPRWSTFSRHTSRVSNLVSPEKPWELVVAVLLAKNHYIIVTIYTTRFTIQIQRLYTVPFCSQAECLFKNNIEFLKIWAPLHSFLMVQHGCLVSVQKSKKTSFRSFGISQKKSTHQYDIG